MEFDTEELIPVLRVLKIFSHICLKFQIKLSTMSPNNTVKKRKVKITPLQDKKESSAAKDMQLEDKIGVLEEKLKSEKKKIDDLKKQIECPVCLEVPREGPVFSCPNGHHVCKKCKRDSCPTCREVMGDNKSLVAVAIIERILHECKFVECEEEFPLDEIDTHEKICKHRVVACPHSLCFQMVPLSKLLTHLQSNRFCCYMIEPKVVYGSFANYSVASLVKAQEDLPQTSQLTFKVGIYCYDGHFFALNMRKAGDYWQFVTVMFESPEVCAEFNLEMEVKATIKSPADTPLSAKVLCHPCSIDAELEGSGLIVHRKFMEDMVIKKGEAKFTISSVEPV